MIALRVMRGELTPTRMDPRAWKEACDQEVSALQGYGSREWHPVPGLGIFPMEVGSAQIQKYLRNRKKLFSRWDQGVWVDEDMLYSVAPEEAAAFSARKIAQELGERGIQSEEASCLDLFGGAGGFAI